MTSAASASRSFKNFGVMGAIALSALAMPSMAQNKMDHGAHKAPVAPASAEASPSTKAFQASDEKMMKEMGVAYTGDADRDFVAHMIPHHEGAVAMAQVQLKYGKDPELRKMAQEIVKAQETEIAFMKKWQAKNAVK